MTVTYINGIQMTVTYFNIVQMTVIFININVNVAHINHVRIRATSIHI